MKLSTMRRIDYFVGIPACFLLTAAVRLIERLRPARTTERPRKVLFIELSEMGSTILASAAMRRVHERYPDAEHCFVIFRKNAPSLRLLHLFPERNIFTIRDGSLRGIAIDLFRFMKFCRDQQIDTVIDLELFSRISSMLSLLSGARTRVGFHNYHGEGLYRGEHLTHRVHYNPYYHMAQNFMALIESLERDPEELPQPKRVLPVQPPPVRVGTDPDAYAFVRDELVRCFPAIAAHRVVIVNHDAGSLLPIRSWPLEKFIELIGRLLASDPRVVVVLMGIAEAKESARTITERIGDPRCVDFVGKTRTLTDVIQLFHQADLLITNDSGPAHFATLTPIKSITLFGPETPLLYGPLGDDAVHLYAGLHCSPCLSALNNRNSPCTDNVCMQMIGVDEVMRHAVRLLDQRTSERPAPLVAASGDARGAG